MSDVVERAARVAAPAVLALFVAIGVVLSDGPLALSLAAGVVAVALAVALAARDVTGWPVVGALSMVAVCVTVICNANPANLGWFALCVLAGWVTLRASTGAAAAFAAALVWVFVTQWLAVSSEPGWGAWIAGTVFTTVACLQAQRQVDLVEQLRAAQAGLADRARAEERTRIAREMHDVIGHALTVSLLHVTSARLALDESPDEARASLDEAERLARQSLAEVRATVSLMRDPCGSTSPLPGLVEVDDLVDSFRRAGTEVSYDVTGDVSALTATEGLTVYRILQEALTNVVRHSPGDPAVVRVEVADGRARLVVESPGAPGAQDTGGSGLAGMRERAEAVGGRLTAGPWRSGWRVEAVLPA